MTIWKLLITTGVLYGVQGDFSLPVNASIYEVQTSPWLYYTLSPWDTANPYVLLELTLETPAAAILATRVEGPPLYISSADYLLADEVDFEGWFSGKTHHYLRLAAEIVSKGTFVGVYFNHSGRAVKQMSYQIHLEDTSRCPFHCSNRGICTPDHECQCTPNTTGSDCSISNTPLTEQRSIQVNLTGTEWVYLSINVSECNFYIVSSSSLVANLNWTQGGIEVLTKYEDHMDVSRLPSLFEYTERHVSYESPMDIHMTGREMWRLAVRQVEGMDRGIEVSFVVGKDTSRPYSRLRWILVSCGLVTLSLVLVLIVYKVWLHRRRHQAFNYAHHESTSSRVPSSLLDYHFPAHLFKQSHTEQAACPICLDVFLPNSVTRRLACGHEFHSECLTTWFQSNTECCICHRDYAGLVVGGGEFGSDAKQTLTSDLTPSDTMTQNDTQAPELFSFRT